MENLIRAFSVKLWIGFFLSTLFVFIVLVFANNLPAKMRNLLNFAETERVDYQMVLIIIVGEGTSTLPSKNFLRLIIMSFVLLCLVLRTAYLSEMFNFLQSGDCKKVVETLREMEERKFNLFVPSYVEVYMTLDELKTLYDER